MFLFMATHGHVRTSQTGSCEVFADWRNRIHDPSSGHYCLLRARYGTQRGQMLRMYLFSFHAHEGFLSARHCSALPNADFLNPLRQV